MLLTEEVLREALYEIISARPQGSRAVHPSSLKCVRQVTFRLLDFPVKSENLDLDTFILMETGTAIHRMIQDWLKKGLPAIRAGVTFDAEVKIDEKNERAAPLLIRGSADGIIHTPIGDELLEIKTVGSNGLASLKGVRDDHVEQVNTYLYCLNIIEGNVMYVSRNNTGLMKVFPIRFNPELWRATEAKIKVAIDAAMEDRLPPTDVGNYTCRICPYDYVCAKKKEWCDAEDSRSRLPGVLDPGEGEG